MTFRNFNDDMYYEYYEGRYLGGMDGRSMPVASPCLVTAWAGVLHLDFKRIKSINDRILYCFRLHVVVVGYVWIWTAMVEPAPSCSRLMQYD